MPAEPTGWNVVVIGAWNPAILSPNGVSRRLFELPEGTPIELEIAVDKPGAFRVGHGGLTVIPTSTRLEVAPRASTAESMRRACEICQRALLSLPETPVSAVGINIRYKMADVPDDVLDLVRAPLDGALSDAAFTVGASVTKRSVTLPPGVVNVEIKTQSQAGGALEFNFHRESASPVDLREWLGRIQEFVSMSDQLALVAGVPNVRGEVHA